MNATLTERPDGVVQGARQALTFVLGAETYGIDILRVQEIRGWSAVTRIPEAPAHVLGVLNLRGSIVPVLDLRMRFGLASAEYSGLTVIIVLSVNTAAGRRDVGLVVDGVSDVVSVDQEKVQPAPDVGARQATRYILGIVTVADRLTVLLDVDRLIDDDLACVGAAEAAA